jgi:hypothetical protein
MARYKALVISAVLNTRILPRGNVPEKCVEIVKNDEYETYFYCPLIVFVNTVEDFMFLV